MAKVMKWQDLIVVSLIAIFLSLWRCEAFLPSHQGASSRSMNSVVVSSFSNGPAGLSSSTTSLNVLSEPPMEGLGPGTNKKSNKFPNNRRRQNTSTNRNSRAKNYYDRRKKEDVWSSGRWSHAKHIETDFLNALEALQMSIKMEGDRIKKDGGGGSLVYPLPFPAIRDCNAALAAFGDGGDLLRALRLYFKMRKLASLSKRYPPKTLSSVPAPTLVTYSTMMSRAVKMGKPLVALRLWNIMRRQIEFFSSDSDVPTMRRIVPDAKAANILMNCYSKLGNLEAAQDLLEQMLKGGGEDVPQMTPNLVTYNTLLDACHKSNELDDALKVKDYMELAGIRPDARTYTTLIATVARKASVASGANDPTLAFSLLQEMQTLQIRPNGMTYSALIDACGRCRRSDLALKALRLMLDQKTNEQRISDSATKMSSHQGGYALSNEVGAWTAAINACGKAGRIDAALKLFHSMPNFGVSPNTVTCGCLADCLLRNGRVTESLSLLRYMKTNRIAPSEVMYTSLMTSAGRLAKLENERLDVRNIRSDGSSSGTTDVSEARAVDVYSELMRSLMQTKREKKSSNGFATPALLGGSQDDSKEVYRVSLVFQEMKAAGVTPDLACYNAMLRSCANAGDIRRAEDVLNQIKETDDIEPNSKTWTEMIKAAGKAGRVDVALSSWKEAVEQSSHDDDKSTSKRNRGRIDTESLGALLSVIVGSVRDERVDDHTVLRLQQLVFKMYEAILSGSNFLGMNLVSRDKMFRNPRLMLTFLHGIVELEERVRNGTSIDLNPKDLRKRATEIIMQDCLRNGVPNNLRMNNSYANAYHKAKGWFRGDHKKA